MNACETHVTDTHYVHSLQDGLEGSLPVRPIRNCSVDLPRSIAHGAVLVRLPCPATGSRPPCARILPLNQRFQRDLHREAIVSNCAVAL